MDKKLSDLLILNEGLKLKAYSCTAGKRTIGVGRNFQDVPFSLHECIDLFGTTSISFNNANHILTTRGITKEQALMLLENDVVRCIKQLERQPYWEAVKDDEDKRNALIDLCFNMGFPTLSTFKNTLAAIEAGDWEKAVENLTKSKWYTQVGDRGPRIVKMICPSYYEPKKVVEPKKEIVDEIKPEIVNEIKPEIKPEIVDEIKPVFKEVKKPTTPRKTKKTVNQNL